MEKSKNVRERAFNFAVDVVVFCRLAADRDAVTRRLAYQLMDAAGSVGANLAEASGGQSKADFIAKTCIALKEAREAKYWLELVLATTPALAPGIAPIRAECSEIIAMLVAGVKRARTNPWRGEQTRS